MWILHTFFLAETYFYIKIALNLFKYSYYLLNVCEPESPIGISQFVVQLMLDNLGEVELRRVPTADPVVRPEVAVDLEAVRCCRIPLKYVKYKVL